MTAIANPPVLIHRSCIKLIGLLACSSALVTLGVWMADGGAADMRGQMSVFAGWGIAAFFAYTVFVGVRRLFSTRPLVELSEAGLLDRRQFRKAIPWAAVRQVSTRPMLGAPVLRIHLTEDALREVDFTAFAAANRRLSKLFGQDHIEVTAMDLDVSAWQLLGHIRQHLQANNPEALAGGKPG